jgi:pyrroline-5-carboxylate reductase
MEIMADAIKVGFLGAGKMAGALAKGLISAGCVKPSGVSASDVYAQAREAFEKSTGGRTFASNNEVMQQSDVVFLAVKPNQVEEVLAQIKPQFKSRHLLISIAAGVTLHSLESGLPTKARVIRVMPNTPALVGASASGYSLGRCATAADGALAAQLLGAVGVAFQVGENLLDAVTGLSGSGPAYAYLMIEALSDGGVAAGLPREVATRLAAQTLLGSARMVLETGLHPGVLKDMVTSPGGTTIEALHELEKAGVRGALMTAVRVAADKAKRLGQS